MQEGAKATPSPWHDPAAPAWQAGEGYSQGPFLQQPPFTGTSQVLAGDAAPTSSKLSKTSGMEGVRAGAAVMSHHAPQ